MATKHLPVICGETTCFDFETKTRCRFVGTKRFGTIWVCMLYKDRDGNDIVLPEKDECLQRLPQCIAEIK